VACTRTEPARVGDPETSSSSFTLIDDTTLASKFGLLCKYIHL
jgi:hypothetical protein